MKVDQRQGLGGGVVVRDHLGRLELPQHQHVGVGQQHVEGPYGEHWARHLQPRGEMVAPWPGRNEAMQAAVDQHHLQQRRRPGGKGERGHARRRVGRQTHGAHRRHGDDQDQRAQHERRQERGDHRVVGAGGGVQHVRQRVERQRGAGEIERQHGVALQRAGKSLHQDGADHRHDGRRGEHHPAAAEQEAAQAVVVRGLSVFREWCAGR